MAIDLGTAVVNFTSSTSGFEAGFGRVAGMMGGLPGIMGIGAVAIAGVGIAATKMAGDFEAGVTQLVTGAGESTKNIGLIKSGLLDLSVSTATSTKALTDGLFLIESAGFHGADGLAVLQTAAEGAKVGNADLTSVSDVLTTSLHDYAMSASQATDVMNSLIRTVANGKMHMDDLNSSLTNALPVASALHVHLSDVEGALATMAAAGDRGSAAGTHLAMMLKMLENPAKSASKEMAAMGINSIQLAKTMETSLPDALIMIQNAVAQHFVPGSVEYNRAIAAIVGGSKSGIAGLEIMGKNMTILRANTNDAAAALRAGGSSVQGWTLIQQDFNFKVGQAQQALAALMITIGTGFLPIAGRVIGAITPIISNFSQWLSAMGGIAGVLQKIGDAFQIVFGPVQQVGKAIAFVHDTAKPFLDTFDRATAILHGTATAAKPLLDTFDRATAIMHGTEGATTAMLDTFDRATAVLQGKATPAINPFVSALQNLKNVAVPALAAIGAVILSIVVPAVYTLAAGVIAATWPFLAIGAAVFAVVAIFKHFYDTNAGFKSFIDTLIAGFKQVWSIIQANFLPALTNVGNFLKTTVWPILQQLGSWLLSVFAPVWQQLVDVWKQQLVPTFQLLYNSLQPAMPLLKDLAMLVGAVVVVAFGVLIGILAGAARALANLIGSVAIVIGGIVKIFSGFVSIIGGIISFFVDLVTGHFDKLGADLSHIMQGIVTMFSGAWDVISGIFRGAFGAIWGLVSGFVEGFIGFFQHLFSSLVGHSIIPDLVNSIISWLMRLPAIAVQVGSNMINGMISGIESMASSLASSLVSTVSNALASVNIGGFHLPGFAMGGTTPGGPILVGERGPEILSPPSGYGITPLTGSYSGIAGGSPVIHNHFYVDGQELTTRLMTRADQMQRARYGPRARVA